VKHKPQYLFAALIAAAFLLLTAIVYYNYHRIASDSHRYYSAHPVVQGSDEFQTRAWTDILGHATEAYRLDPLNKNTLFDIGFAHFSLGTDTAAIDYLSQHLEFYPYSIGTLHNLGVCYTRLGELEVAKDYFLRAYDISPVEPMTLFMLAQLSEFEGDSTAAIFYYRLALVNDANREYYGTGKSNPRFLRRLNALQERMR